VVRDWAVFEEDESSDEDVESSDDELDEDESSDEDDDVDVEPDVAAEPLDVVVICAVVVFAVVWPIEPSQAIAPQASANVASVAATTRRRRREMRAARAARRSRPRAARSEGGGVDMPPCSAAPPRALRENPENLLGTAAIFDLDGVLVDSRAAISRCMNAALVATGHAALPVEELYRFIGPPQAGSFSELLGEPPDSPVVLECITAYRDLYRRTALDDTTVFAGIPEVLAALAPEHRLAVATSKMLPAAESLLADLGLREHFEHVSGPSPDARGETKAATLARALAALEAERAVMIGDTPYDMVGAAENAIPAIGVAWGIGAPEDLTAAGAHAIVDTPGELPQAVADALR
jgi:phosphoglycolate phosphatase